MRKILITLFATVAGAMLFVAPVFANSTLSVNIEQPKTPNNQQSFNVNFVALTTTSNGVTVKCYKQGPSDGSPVQFGSDIVFAPGTGGNSGDCPVNAGITTTDGTYQFYITADDGNGIVQSSTVSVVVNTTYPETPTGYSKTQIDSCTYKIHIHTASDNGKTVKVEIYRSDSKTFTADGGTRVGSVAIGSNADADFTNSVGDCSKTYFFVIRAFSSNGNGSGVTGDSEANVITTVISPTTTQQQGAIPVGGRTSGGTSGGNVLGSQTSVTSPTPSEITPTGEKEVLGDQTVSPTETTKSFFSSKKNLAIVGVIVVIFLGILFVLFRRMRNK